MKGRNKAKNQTIRGAGFYTKKKKLRPILVYVNPDVHEALKQIASDEDRSLQKTVMRMLTENVRGRKSKKGR